jgi:hypothetical protein
MVLIWYSLDVVVAIEMDVTASLTSDLITLVGNLFHYHPTYSDLFIARRITEDYGIKLSGRQVRRIRLQQGWLRRFNNPAVAEAEQALTFDAIEQLLAEGRIRQYGRRQLITHLSRKYGHRPRGNHVREALQALDAYGVISRRPGMRRMRYSLLSDRIGIVQPLDRSKQFSSFRANRTPNLRLDLKFEIFGFGANGKWLPRGRGRL